MNGNMETVRCTCKQCTTVIGDFANLWTRIGKSYFSPVVQPESEVAIVSHGAVRLGEIGTLVEACQLQDITCIECSTILGIKCLNTPVNHVLDENQILLRATSVVPLSKENGGRVDLAVKRYLKLREPSRRATESNVSGTNEDRPPSRRGASTRDGYPSSESPRYIDLSQLQADLDAQRGEIDRIDSAGFKVVSALDEAVTRIEGNLDRMGSTLSGLQRDLKDNRSDISSLKQEVADNNKTTDQDRATIRCLEAQLSSTNDNIEGVRREMGSVATQFRQQFAQVTSQLHDHRESIQELRDLMRDKVSARDHAKEMVSIRNELTQLRKQMEENRSKPVEQFPSRELDILTSSIAKIGNRASHVESLQMEFEIFKGRVERMERARQQDREQSGSAEISPYDQYPNDDDDNNEDNDEDYSRGTLAPARKRRRPTGLDGNANSTKRAAYTPHFPDTPDSGPGRVSNRRSSSPVANSGRTKIENRIHAAQPGGNVDARSRRASNRSRPVTSNDDRVKLRRRGR